MLGLSLICSCSQKSNTDTSVGENRPPRVCLASRLYSSQPSQISDSQVRGHNSHAAPQHENRHFWFSRNWVDKLMPLQCQKDGQMGLDFIVLHFKADLFCPVMERSPDCLPQLIETPVLIPWCPLYGGCCQDSEGKPRRNRSKCMHRDCFIHQLLQQPV